MRRFPLFVLAAATLAASCGPVPAPAWDADPGAANDQRSSLAQIPPRGPFTLELVADFNIPTGASFEGIPAVDFGGISGVFFDPDRMEIVAITDSRANNRYFTLGVQFDGDSISFTPQSVTHLADAGRQDPNRTLAARRAFDPESIDRAPNGNLIVSTEGSSATEPRIAPTIAEYKPDGQFVRFLTVPDKFVPEAVGLQTQGVANNLAFESLAISPDGSRVFAATESALLQDDTRSDFDKGSRARILEIGIEGDVTGSIREYIYAVEPMTAPADFTPVASENGLVELLALSNTELLALERSFFLGGTRENLQRRNVVRLFRVSLEGATDVAGIFSIVDQAELVPVQKQLVLDLDDILPDLSPEYPELDNFEGLCMGPTLPDGSPSLIIVSDNNFNPWQRTAFLLFRIRTD